MKGRSKKFHFTVCKPQIQVAAADVQHLPKLYPYGVWYYKDLDEQARAFITDKLTTYVGSMEVVGVSAHNGKGKQWGLILLRYPGTEGWSIAAQFGHTKLWRLFWAVRLWMAHQAVWCTYTNREFDRPRRLDSLSHA
jgi:hypothetical protein